MEPLHALFLGGFFWTVAARLLGAAALFGLAAVAFWLVALLGAPALTVAGWLLAGLSLAAAAMGVVAALAGVVFSTAAFAAIEDRFE